MRLSQPRLRFGSARHQPFGLNKLPRLEMQETERIKGLYLIWLSPQHFAIQPRRLLCLAACVQPLRVLKLAVTHADLEPWLKGGTDCIHDCASSAFICAGRRLEMPSDPLSQAIEYYRSGRIGDAEERCRFLLAVSPDHTEANHLLGAICFQQNKFTEAVTLLRRAAESPNATAEMQNHLGSAYKKLGDNRKAAEAFERAIAMKPDYADALHNLGVVYSMMQKSDESLGNLREAVVLKPELLQENPDLRGLYHGVVPGWHFAMMDHHKRNEAYEAAIRRGVRGKRVLDIGTGSGLLALRAARAGAAKVTACEAVPLIGKMAREIIARNGYQDCITVVPKASMDMTVPRDMPERAQVLITETFASGLITEGVLPTVEHAHQHLLTPDATVIPASASVMGYLAGGPALEGMLFVDRISGFDLSQFNAFAPSMLATALDQAPHDALSDDVELMRFDLRDRTFPSGEANLALTATRPGVCVGIVQWIRLQLDAHTRFENRPAADTPFNEHWTHIIHRFPRLVRVAPGDVVPVLFRHDRTQISVQLGGSQSEK